MKLSYPADQLFGFDEISFDHASVLDFWLWSYSILSNDPTKGEFAEWMVGKLLGLQMSHGGRIEGADWDLQSPEGVKIEVKTAAYWQAWKLRNRYDGSWRKPTQADIAKLTPIKFAGLHRQPATGPQVKSDFKADLYVLCLQHEKDLAKWNGVDLKQWSFFALPKAILIEMKKKRDSKYKDDSIPKTFDLKLSEVESVCRRMTAVEFQREAAVMVRSLASTTNGVTVGA